VPNTLYYGDNLDILRNHIVGESVDLVYLDPPFNSNRNYNVLFREKSGESSPSQIQAFTDTWQWDRNAETAFDDLIDTGPHNVATMISAMREFVGRNDMMAYLVMMAQRLVELHRVLKPTGSLYLHCDPTASHYLKILLDTIFGKECFRNEIVWKRQSAHSDARTKFSDVADVLLFYVRSTKAIFNPQYTEHDPDYIAKFYRFDDKDGRGLYRLGDMSSPNPRPNLTYDWKGFTPPPKGWRYEPATMARLDAEGRIKYPVHRTGELDITKRPSLKRYLGEQEGSIVTNIWDDVMSLHSSSNERLGYPTQKPLALLERIISASSNPGDVVLDPFCGCGTAVVAAQKLGRAWVGIDITHLSIALMKNRLVDMFGPAVSFEIRGEPEDVGSATMLAEQDRYQFQWWAASLVNAQPVEGREKKGADRGIDGVIRFVDDAGQKLKRVIVQIKSGHVSSATMRDLIGTLNREDAEMALLVTLEPPTKPMRQEAVEAGDYYSPSWNRTYPRVQIATIEELLAGDLPQIPPMRATFDRAQRIRSATHAQSSLLTD